jgi:hypothetical protein
LAWLFHSLRHNDTNLAQVNDNNIAHVLRSRERMGQAGRRRQPKQSVTVLHRDAAGADFGNKMGARETGTLGGQVNQAERLGREGPTP